MWCYCFFFGVLNIKPCSEKIKKAAVFNSTPSLFVGDKNMVKKIILT